MKTAFAMVLLLLVLPAAPHAETQVAEVRPPSVTVAAAERGQITETVSVTGPLVPHEEIMVSPQIYGVAITEILAEEGDTVKAGQVLARLSREAPACRSPLAF